MKKPQRRAKSKRTCPNCWGEQEYEGAFWESSKNAHVDLNNILQKKGWIQAYMAKYFEGIQRNTADNSPEYHINWFHHQLI